MNRTVTIIVAIIGIVLIGAGVWYVAMRPSSAPVVVTPPPQATSTVQTYASSTLGVSLQYPEGYTVNESYAYDQFGQKKLIHGVSFTIPQSMATGTNLSTDTRITVEQLPNAKNCTGDIYLLANVKPTEVTDNGVTYSVASSSDAAAGNRYEETVYAIKGSNPCTAVRYFIHYGAIENYAGTGTIEFDRNKLMSDFDSIRRSLTLTQSAV